MRVLLILLIGAAPLWAQTGLVETFDDSGLPGWDGGTDYGLSAERGVMKVDANKRDTWNSFTYSFSALDISAHPYVSVIVRTDTDVNLGFSVWDADGSYDYPRYQYLEIIRHENFVEYCFDFSRIDDEVDLTSIERLNF